MNFRPTLLDEDGIGEASWRELMPGGIYKLYQWMMPGIRQRRIQLLLDRCHPGPATRILDVGGHFYDWEKVVPVESPVTFLNVTYPPGMQRTGGRFTSLIGDGRHLAFPNQSFDIVFSNSVIEHVGGFADQQRFASEARRVGRQVFVQTPNRWFFIEPHFLTLFVHFLPRQLARYLLRVLSLRAFFRHGDNVELQELADELRLLSVREMQSLFPDCEIYREKWLGFTKSFIAIRDGPCLLPRS